MKKATSVPSSIDEYIAQFPPDVAARLRQMRATIREHAPDAEERIAYRMPTFWQGGNLVHFAAFAHHIGFYPAPSGMTAFAKELARYASGKGSLQLPHDEPLPLALVAKMVKFRVQENARAASAKAKRPTKRATKAGAKQGNATRKRPVR